MNLLQKIMKKLIKVCHFVPCAYILIAFSTFSDIFIFAHISAFKREHLQNMTCIPPPCPPHRTKAFLRNQSGDKKSGWRIKNSPPLKTAFKSKTEPPKDLPSLYGSARWTLNSSDGADPEQMPDPDSPHRSN